MWDLLDIEQADRDSTRISFLSLVCITQPMVPFESPPNRFSEWKEA